MPITQLDPKTALIVIDLQKGILAFPTAHPTDKVVKLARQVIGTFHQHHLPIVFVNVDGVAPGRTESARPRLDQLPPDWAELVPELNRQPSDHLVTKRTWGAFTNTGLDEHLKKLGVTQVVILGVATSVGVESTARYAYENGYHITLAIDAMTDMNADAHTNSVTRIFPKLGETGTTQEIIDLLNKRT
jgi:nicotinamidase-related amidase